MFALHPFRSKNTSYQIRLYSSKRVLYDQLFENDNKRKTKDIITLDVIEELSKNMNITNSYVKVIAGCSFSQSEILSETLTVI